MRVTVQPGEIIVSTVDVIINHRNVKVVELDLTSKYAEILSYEHHSDGMQVNLYRGEYTIKTDPDRAGIPTGVIIAARGNWTVVATCTRYTARIVLYRCPDRIREWLRHQWFRWRAWRYQADD